MFYFKQSVTPVAASFPTPGSLPLQPLILGGHCDVERVQQRIGQLTGQRGRGGSQQWGKTRRLKNLMPLWHSIYQYNRSWDSPSMLAGSGLRESAFPGTPYDFNLLEIKIGMRSRLFTLKKIILIFFEMLKLNKHRYKWKEYKFYNW